MTSLFFNDSSNVRKMLEIKVKYIGKRDPLALINGNIYEVVVVEGDDPDYKGGVNKMSLNQVKEFLVKKYSNMLIL